MAEVINLRSARKAKARDEAATTAATNRAAFGRTKAEKAEAAAQRARDAEALDGAKRDR